ncbi:MFS transporter [Paraburkholderia sp. J67]|uniref:MFS transporter n=1 Tax=Paraburkholderia sp. J67 TaxID=2805435 RepID=UPI002ABE4760|nr:MFS transporter [Paraburkholderia sp. J67]
MNILQEGGAALDTQARPGRASRVPYRWRLLAALWLIIVCAVSVPSIGSSVVNAHMAAALHFDRTVIGLGFGLFILTMGVPGPLVAALIRRFGVKRVVLAGCALLVVGTLATGTVVASSWAFPPVFGLLVGAGVACAGILPAQAAVARWFPDKRALAVSIVLSAIDIGGTFAPPALDKIIAVSSLGWRAGWYAMSAAALLALLITALVMRDDGAGEDATPSAAPFAETAHVFNTTHAWPLRDALHCRAYWLIMGFSCVVGLDWMLLMAHGVVHLVDSGYSSAAAAFAIAVMIASSLAGNLVAGLLGDRIAPHRIGAAAMALLTMGLYAAVRPDVAAGPWLFAVPAGLGYGASQVCLMALLGNYFGARIFAQLFGILLAVGTLTGSALVGAAGAVFDHTGSYTPVFVLCLVLSALAVFAIAFAAPPRIPRSAQVQPANQDN